MVKSFHLPPGKLGETVKGDLHFRIRDMVEGKKCNTPQCWPLADPGCDQIYLSKFETFDRKGRHVQTRRLLFYLEYGFDPNRRVIRMLCGNKNCINPAHMTIKLFEIVFEQMNPGRTLLEFRQQQITHIPPILTMEQANKWDISLRKASA